MKSDPALASRLTLTDLLSHLTGLSRLDSLWLGANGEVIIPKNLTVVMCNNLYPIYPLRSKWLYNNWMYALAGEIIERVTQLSFGHALASQVLDRVGLTETTIMESLIPPNSTALPYLVLDDKSAVLSPDLGLTDGILMSSAGGIRSTTHDMMAWGQTLLDTFRQQKSLPEPLDLRPSAEKAAKKWRGTHQDISDALEKGRIPETNEPQHADLLGRYEHETGALYLEVSEEEGGNLMFSINGKESQTHNLTHYHHDSFTFLPTAADRIRRGLFHYSVPAWLLHFERNDVGDMDRVVWNVEEQAPHGEIFTKLKRLNRGGLG